MARTKCDILGCLKRYKKKKKTALGESISGMSLFQRAPKQLMLPVQVVFR